MFKETRDRKTIKQHYLIEKNLANKLRRANKAERQPLYTEIYDEFFKTIPNHPQLQIKNDATHQHQLVNQKLSLLKKFLHSDTTFLEIGAGDGALSLQVASIVKKVHALEVSSEISRTSNAPDNFEFLITDGTTIPLPLASVDIAYSNQVMEHLHPEDALEQLKNIYRTIKPNGLYVCLTPNKFSGPHDISKYFDTEATGFHLHEYTTAELKNIFIACGFKKVKSFIGGLGYYWPCPTFLIILFEKFLDLWPFDARKIIARSLFGRALLGIIIIGIK